eukprot:GHRR01010391.1.p1 GENE.GHRR01010391.1~~GHRR01010391.1.p1  ORF type:complete len:992 (+),score=591.69 GHRR01010391.1:638-3613(+)
MPLSICREEVLADRQYFGAFGRIKKVSVNRSTPFSQVQKNGPSGSAYVTYYRPEDALRCIEAIDGSVWDGKTIKACFGTTKYCNAFLKGVPCNNLDCLYLHDVAEAGDSFSKEDMVVNGLATGRSTFFDLVHPTSTKEAAAHAHAAIGSTSSTSSSTTGMPGVAAAVGAPSAATSTSGSSGGGAAPALGRAPSQPVAITGAHRCNSSNPWGSGGGDGPATASPSRPGAAAMAAAAATGQWGVGSARAAQPMANSLTSSSLADMEWPSLAAAVDAAADARPTSSGGGAPDQQQQQQQSSAAAGGSASMRAFAEGLSASLQHPSASANSHPVSHPVGNGIAPTAAAIVAGLVPAASKQQQQQGKQQQQQQQKAMATLMKPAKGAKATTAAKPDAAAKLDALQQAAPVQVPHGKAGSAAAVAAAASRETAVGSPASSSSSVDSSDKVAQQPNGIYKDKASAPAAAVAAMPPMPAATSKMTKHEAKRAAKAAAKQAAAAAAASDATAAAASNGAAQTAPHSASDGASAVAAAVPATTPAAQQPSTAAPQVGAKGPPPGFVGAGPRVKGPPPGFESPLHPGQQRPPPLGFEPSLLAMARAGSNNSLSHSSAGQAGALVGNGSLLALQHVTSISGAGASAPSGIGQNTAGVDAGVATGAAYVNGSISGAGTSSRRSSSSEQGSAAGAAVDTATHEAGNSSVAASRPPSRDTLVAATAGAAAASGTASSEPYAPMQQQQSLFGFGGMDQQQSLFSSNTANAFDVNAFFDASSCIAPVSPLGSGSMFAGSLYNPLGHPSPLASVVAPAAGGSSVAGADEATPLTARKQSRWGFAQQPQQQQAATAAAAPATPHQQQLRAPPGFAGGESAAAAAAGAGSGAAANGFAGLPAAQSATSFFKHFLPGVNVHVAAAPAVAGDGAAAGPAGIGFTGGLGAAPALGANPGMALLQQLQRGGQQQQHPLFGGWSGTGATPAAPPPGFGQPATTVVAGAAAPGLWGK